MDLYDADPSRVVTVAPGVDLEHFRPGGASGARTRLGVPADAVLLLFVGRTAWASALTRAVAERRRLSDVRGRQDCR